MKLAPSTKNLLHSSMLFWFWLSWLVLAISSWLFCPDNPALALLSMQFSSGCLDLAVLSFAAPSWLSCPGCPVLCSPILAVLSWLSSPFQSHPGCLVLAVLSFAVPPWLSCPGSPVMAVLFWLSFPDILAGSLAVLSWQSYCDCPVLAVPDCCSTVIDIFRGNVFTPQKMCSIQDNGSNRQQTFKRMFSGVIITASNMLRNANCHTGERFFLPGAFIKICLF